MKKLSKILFVFAAIALTGCFEDPGTDIIWPDSLRFVEIEQAATAAGSTVSNAYNQQDEDVPTPEVVTFGLASPTLDEPVTVTFEIGGSAIEGVHYEMVTQGNQVTIPAGEHFASVDYEILTYNIPPGETWDLTFTITDVQGGDAEISANYETYTNRIETLCPSNIPEGTWIESRGVEVTITKLSDTRYEISQMNIGYYSGDYGDVFGEFVDVCNVLTLQGVQNPDAFNIAWIGSGTYDADAQTLTFSVSDATYNPDASITQIYTFVE